MHDSTYNTNTTRRLYYITTICILYNTTLFHHFALLVPWSHTYITETVIWRLYLHLLEVFFSVCSFVIYPYDVCYHMSNRRLLDVFKMFMIYNVCKTDILKTSARCFPDQAIFIRHLPDYLVWFWFSLNTLAKLQRNFANKKGKLCQ